MSHETELPSEAPSAERPAPLPSAQNPELVDVTGGEAMPSVTFEDGESATVGGEARQAKGFYSGRYFLSDGKTEVHLVMIRNANDDFETIEVVDGKRTQPFKVGEAVRMPRTGAPVDETGWKVIETKMSEQGVPLVESARYAPDGKTIVSRKVMSLSKLRSYNQPPALKETLEPDEAVAAARLVVGLEAAIDQHSAEIAAEEAPVSAPEQSLETADSGSAEHEPVLSEVVIKDLGVEGLEASGVEEPEAQQEAAPIEEAAVLEEAAPTEETPEEAAPNGVSPEQVRALYERQADTVRDEADKELAKLSAAVNTGHDEFMTAQKGLIEHITYDALIKLEGTLRNVDDYPIGALRTVMIETSNLLQGALNDLRRFNEQAVYDVDRLLEGADTALAPFIDDGARVDVAYEEMSRQVQGKGDESSTPIEGTTKQVLEAAKEEIGPTDMIRQEVKGLSEQLSIVARGVVDPQIQHLEAIRRASYDRPIDTNELVGIIYAIRNAAQWTDIDAGIRKTADDLGGLSERIGKARSLVMPQ